MSVKLEMRLDKSATDNLRRLSGREYFPILKGGIAKLTSEVVKNARKHTRVDTGLLKKNIMPRVTGSPNTGYVYAIAGAANINAGKSTREKNKKNPAHYHHMENFGFTDKAGVFHEGSHSFEKAVAELGTDMGYSKLMNTIKEAMEGVMK